MNHLQVLEDQGCTTPRFLGIFFRIHYKDLHKTYHFLGFGIQPALGAPNPPGSDQTRTSQRGRSQPCRWNASCRCEATKKKGGNGKSLRRVFCSLWGQRITGVTEVKAREVLDFRPFIYFATYLRPHSHHKKVVNSEGILLKMAETFRFSGLYNKLIRNPLQKRMGTVEPGCFNL